MAFRSDSLQSGVTNDEDGVKLAPPAMFKLLRNWRRDRILRQASLDETLWKDVCERLPFVSVLSPQERTRLRELVILFLHEKQFASASGLQLTDEMRVFIAVQACMLILEIGLDHYRGWSGIVVYPVQFVPRHQYTDETGVVHEGDDPHMGEAWLGGPVILSWEDVQGTYWPEGVNVVIHEFAHKLDMLNGGANGFPPLRAGMSRQAWSDAFKAAYEEFRERVDSGEDTDIDPYAAESPGEFFAVLSEAFFEIPDVVLDEYPEVYEQLRLFYKQDPVGRLEAAASTVVA